MSDYQTTRSEVESEYTHLVDYHVVPLYPHVAEIFGARKSFNVLLRPDNHIGFISQETSLSGIRVYLDEFVALSRL